jgi:tetratricopeptide (TPR) repeat protein
MSNPRTLSREPRTKKSLSNLSKVSKTLFVLAPFLVAPPVTAQEVGSLVVVHRNSDLRLGAKTVAKTAHDEVRRVKEVRGDWFHLKGLETGWLRRGDVSDASREISCLYREGRYNQALPLAHQVVEMHLAATDRDHSMTAAAIHDLAKIYDAMAQYRMVDYSNAARFYRQAAEMRLAIPGGDRDPRTADSLVHWGCVRGQLGEVAEGAALCKRAWRIYQQAYGEGHPFSLRAARQYGVLLRDDGHLRQAAGIFDDLLFQRRRHTHEPAPDVAQVLQDVGVLHYLEGDYARAAKSLNDALVIYRQCLGEDRNETIGCLYDLAIVQWRMGDVNGAEQTMHSALSSRRKYLDLVFDNQSEFQQIATTEVLKGTLDAYLAIVVDLVRAREPVAPTAEQPAKQVVIDQVYQHLLQWKGAVFRRQYLARTVRDKKLWDDLTKTTQELAYLWLKSSDNDLRGVDPIADRSLEKFLLEKEIAHQSHEQLLRERKLSALTQAVNELKRVDQIADRSLEKGIARQSQEQLLRERKLSALTRGVNDPNYRTMDSFRKSLHPGAMLVDYYIYSTRTSLDRARHLDGEDRLLAFVVGSQSDISLVDLGPTARIVADIKCWKASYGASAESRSAGLTLRRTIWDPL